MEARDLLIFCGLTALPIAGFMLANFPDTQFYVSLYLLSIVVVIWASHYKQAANPFVFDANLNIYSLIYIVLGTLGVLVVSTFMVRQFVASSLYVPTTKLQMQLPAGIELPPFWADVLFNVALVAPAEEFGKLVTSISFYNAIKGTFGDFAGKAVSVTIPVFSWAILHVYRNLQYQGAYMGVMVSTAFIAGIIMYAVLWKTKSLLASIFVHILYNSVILYMAYSSG